MKRSSLSVPRREGTKERARRRGGIQIARVGRPDRHSAGFSATPATPLTPRQPTHAPHTHDLFHVLWSQPAVHFAALESSTLASATAAFDRCNSRPELAGTSSVVRDKNAFCMYKGMPGSFLLVRPQPASSVSSRRFAWTYKTHTCAISFGALMTSFDRVVGVAAATADLEPIAHLLGQASKPAGRILNEGRVPSSSNRLAHGK
ncbi:hypothetical protein BDK51DRAFT_42701 [Blyttiomyces helicus]|uniref:Uncharacterized protein n=1 Tax=Blyttiomyces helicus TaxID=388810 RepID=A0A4V1IRZ7_9FUNG|nr:hypothetical protein BDK51DRAFT_42701 [Blyttiomyces helicus]|eukprot:RKO91797.1 hypothetical protein BDK51DRAFT_42701 [Blyttiomyces helicus]